jgi:hypothetical protein
MRRFRKSHSRRSAPHSTQVMIAIIMRVSLSLGRRIGGPDEEGVEAG